MLLDNKRKGYVKEIVGIMVMISVFTIFIVMYVLGYFQFGLTTVFSTQQINNDAVAFNTFLEVDDNLNRIIRYRSLENAPNKRDLIEEHLESTFPDKEVYLRIDGENGEEYIPSNPPDGKISYQFFRRIIVPAWNEDDKLTYKRERVYLEVYED